MFLCYTPMSGLPSPPPSVRPRLDEVRVLCVDDDPDTLALYALVLGHCGAAVTEAASLLAALEMFEKVRPAVVVADIGLGDGDGYALVQAIRARSPEQGGVVPAVAITGYAGQADADRALEAGYDVHLVKPIDPARLCELVAQLAGLGRGQKRAQGEEIGSP
jgi:CheY-like chemotaxis protein